LRQQFVHVDVKASGEQHEGQHPAQEDMRQVLGRYQILPPLAQLNAFDRAIHQDDDH
jgi:hypothetical protein